MTFYANNGKYNSYAPQVINDFSMLSLGVLIRGFFVEKNFNGYQQMSPLR